MKVLDLFSGTRSASAPWSRAGHEVIHVELTEGHDVRSLDRVPHCVLIWASPPCQEYSTIRSNSNLRDPDLSLWYHALRIIHASRPAYWIIENVAGAQRFWGRPRFHWGPFYLWGWFPNPRIPGNTHREKKMEKPNALERARIPDALSGAIYEAIIEDLTIRRRRDSAFNYPT